MSDTSKNPSFESFFSPLVTFKDITDFCKVHGLRVYSRSHISKMMLAGGFPAPLYAHERPLHWRRDDVIAWFRNRGVDASLCQG